MTLWIVIGIVVVIALWLIMTYNGLVGGRTQSQTAWSQIDESRADIGNLAVLGDLAVTQLHHRHSFEADALAVGLGQQ